MGPSWRIMPKNIVKAIPLGTFDAANLTAAYQPIYPGGLPHAISLLHIVNRSNVDFLLSYDGATDNDYISVDGDYFLPFQMNSQPHNQVMQVPAGALLSVKWVLAAGIGTIYISGYYNPE
jgi:hypothetical protein